MSAAEPLDLDYEEQIVARVDEEGDQSLAVGPNGRVRRVRGSSRGPR